MNSINNDVRPDRRYESNGAIRTDDGTHICNFVGRYSFPECCKYLFQLAVCYIRRTWKLCRAVFDCSLETGLQ